MKNELAPEHVAELKRLRKRIVNRCNAQDQVCGPGRAGRVREAVARAWREELARCGLRPKVWRHGYLKSIWRLEPIPEGEGDAGQLRGES